MDANGWAAVSAGAAAFTAAITLVIAWANASETRTANQSADFVNSLAVVSSLGDALRRVRDAGDDRVKREFEFRELLNLMEALALLLNDDKATPSARKVAEPFLEQAWAYLKANRAMYELLDASITGTDTFAELIKFADQRAAKIRGLTEAYRRQIEAQGSGHMPEDEPKTD